MNCEQAQQLFDGYLDGELSPSLTTELGAHRLQCPDCRRALALMEVSGHIVATDHESGELRVDFTDRLIACMEPMRKRWLHRAQRLLYVGVPLAAAAVVALAFLGVFDRDPGQAAGHKEEAPPSAYLRVDPLPVRSEESTGRIDTTSQAERRLADWLAQTQKNIEAKEQSGESLQNAMDMTILQLLDVLKRADDAARHQQLPTDTAPPLPTPPPVGEVAGHDDVEDM